MKVLMKLDKILNDLGLDDETLFGEKRKIRLNSSRNENDEETVLDVIMNAFNKNYDTTFAVGVSEDKSNLVIAAGEKYADACDELLFSGMVLSAYIDHDNRTVQMSRLQLHDHGDGESGPYHLAMSALDCHGFGRFDGQFLSPELCFHIAAKTKQCIEQGGGVHFQKMREDLNEHREELFDFGKYVLGQVELKKPCSSQVTTSCFQQGFVLSR